MRKERRKKKVRTVQHTLEVVVGLHIGQIGTDEFVINLILGVSQQDKTGDNTGTTAALHLGGDLSVPEVVVVGDEGTTTVLGHGEQQVAVLELDIAAVDPVILGGVAEILGAQDGIVEVVPLVGLALADGFGGAGFGGVGEERIAASETETTGTTFTVFWERVLGEGAGE